jgi:hypothetical protein
MKPCNPGVATDVPGEGQGEGVSVYVTQSAGDPGGWWLYIYAETPEGYFFVRRVVVTRVFRDRSRIVARLVEPGATTWRVTVEPPKDPDTGAPLATADIRVAAVACPRESASSPVNSVSRGFSYESGAGPAGPVIVPPGGRVKEISAIVGAGGGTLSVTMQRSANTVEALPLVALPASTPFSFNVDSLDDSYVASVTFAGDVTGYVVSWEE